MQSEDELRRDASVLWIDASHPGRLYYFRKNREFKDFHAWDTNTRTELDTRPGLAIDVSKMEAWFEEFLAGKH